MEFKKFILVLGITITTLMSMMFGVSYGWYAYANAETTAIGSTIKEAPTVIFAQTEYIYNNQMLPIYDEDRYDYANKTSFTITLGENLKDYESAVEIKLKDIDMAEELKIENYKYEFLQNGEVINRGNFSKIGNSKELILMPITKLNSETYPQTYTYELYIWLSEDNTDQNNLMNKEFSARVGVESAIKK